MFSKFREGRVGRSRPEEVSTDSLAPDPVQHGRKLSAGSMFSDWARKRSLTPSGTRTAVLRPSLETPCPSYRSSSPSPGPPPRVLGLRTIHRPDTPPLLDIIFIHGLGGDSERSWSKDPKDPSLFWPQQWLPSEPDIGSTRIMSFGYNASFRHGAPKSIYNISDFAKELLYEMKFSTDESGEELNIGKVPIIFVVHSMGGLIAKKAYLLGQNDEMYQDIVRSISAMVFLATPHRGGNLAEVLNKLLTVLALPPRDFIADIAKNSPALEELNEQFRHIAPRLSIMSFYETLATSIGPMKITVLEKDSAIMGYTKEVSRPLDADHHSICKYSSPDDSNYVSVRNALSSLVRRFRSRDATSKRSRTQDEVKELERLLSISFLTEDDLNSIRRRWIPGTCEWILHEKSIKSWLESNGESCVTWFSAPPATGKSTLSAHIITHLRNLGVLCQYFFFKFEDPKKRSLNTLLKSIAYQMATDIPEFKRNLIELSTEGINLAKCDSLLLWKKLFESILFYMDIDGPIYWVIDALDESESPRALLELLASITNSRTAIRILIVSRKTENLSLAFRRLSSSLPFEHIERDSTEFNTADVHTLVENEIKHMRGTDELKQRVAESIESRAQGNFLWTRLVLDDIVNCHSEDAIREALDNIPDDMNNLYRRIELGILENPRKGDISLAKAVLQWTICASRLLSIKELSQALRPEFPEMLDLASTVQDVCGHFVVIKPSGHVAIVHQTARDYLISKTKNERFIDPGKAHEDLFIKSISVLGHASLRLKLTHGKLALRSTEPFLFYAVTSWVYHLRHAKGASDDIFNQLVNLFKGVSVLTWIHALALAGELEVLVKAAKVLSTFVNKRRSLNPTMNPLLHRLSDLDLLEKWAIDLVKIVGKFSRQLLSDPPAIYKLIPPLCPESSILRQQFYRPESAKVTITGISNAAWNDNLAKLELPDGDYAQDIACAGHNIAILGWSGAVYICDSANFADICTLRHQEPVTAFCMNTKGTLVVTYGLKNTNIWSIESGRLQSSTLNPRNVKAGTICFAENDTKVLAGLEDNSIRFIHTEDIDSGWQLVNSSLLKENSPIEGTVISSPGCVAFNNDRSQVGVSYRGSPLTVWDLNGGYCIGRCKRAKSSQAATAMPSTDWSPVNQFTWNPVSGHIIGIYKAAAIFKWHPLTDESHEVRYTADEIAASSDGKLFVTSNSNGTVCVWNFSYFSAIYQLSSSDLVTRMAFSPDSTRFYDLRDDSVNAWEPNALTRISESDESYSDTASEGHSTTVVSHTSDMTLTQYEKITSVAAASSCPWYCAGNEEGSVTLCNLQTGVAMDLFKFDDFFAVNAITWSPDETHIAASDLAGTILIKKFLTKSNEKAELTLLATPRIDLEGSGIQQILFNSDSSLLLIISNDKGQIWSLGSEKVTAELSFDQDIDRQWIQHPTQPAMFLALGATDVRVFRWRDFKQEQCLIFQNVHRQLNCDAFVDSDSDLFAEGSGSLAIHKAMLTQDKKHILVQTRNTSSDGRIAKELFLFSIHSFNPKQDSDNTIEAIRFDQTTSDVMSKIDIPLGIISESRLVFLDPELWLCTLKLKPTSDDQATLQRHYFIPRDWTSTEDREQCAMMEDGSLLCPREDKVAVIRSNLDGAPF